jgi:hypothetical protein
MTTRQAGGIALVLIVISVFLMVVFSTIELVEERRSLAERRGLQDNPLRDAAKLQRQFEALGAGVTELAAAGDSSAKTVVGEMRREGVILPEPKH